YCSKDVFEAWFEQFLTPILEPCQIVILDESAFCKSNKINSLAEKRVEPSLKAVFIEYGKNKHGYFNIPEKQKEAFFESYSGGDSTEEDVISVNQKMLVKLTKEERGSKGAAFTTYITLVGKSRKEIEQDYNYLSSLWQIQENVSSVDILSNDVEVIISGKEAFET
ncbi:hypothetical protein DICVIV_14159, partial [Dictyocaulus viviparus]